MIEENKLASIIKDISKDVSLLEPVVADVDASFDSMFLKFKPQNFVTLSSKYSAVIGQIDKIIRESEKALSISTDQKQYNSRSNTPSLQKKEINEENILEQHSELNSTNKEEVIESDDSKHEE